MVCSTTIKSIPLARASNRWIRTQYNHRFGQQRIFIPMQRRSLLLQFSSSLGNANDAPMLIDHIHTITNALRVYRIVGVFQSKLIVRVAHSGSCALCVEFCFIFRNEKRIKHATANISIVFAVDTTQTQQDDTGRASWREGHEPDVAWSIVNPCADNKYYIAGMAP